MTGFKESNEAFHTMSLLDFLRGETEPEFRVRFRGSVT